MIEVEVEAKQTSQEKFLSLFKDSTITMINLPDDLTTEELLSRYDPAIHEFFTLILQQELIEKERFENTFFVTTEYETQLSAIKSQASRLIHDQPHNRFYAVQEIINQYYPEDRVNRKKWYKEFDHYMDSLFESYYPEAMEILLHQWTFEKFDGLEEDFDEEQYHKIIKKHKEAFLEYRESIFLPSYFKRYSLNFENILPDPLGQFNHACFVKQFYFIKNEKELWIANGCGCGPTFRYQHSLLGHYFAMLEQKGVLIKSFIGRINSECQFEVLRDSEQLILYAHNLSGNYDIDYEESKKILKNTQKYFG